MSAPPVEDEWEYEYDADETDELYFTLDLSAHQSRAATVDEQVKRFRKRKREKLQQQNINSTATLGADTSDHPSDGSRLQILDLHSTEPLIKVDGALYSGSWFSDLGSQIYVTRAGAINNPLRPGFRVDIVAASRARLACRPVTLTARRSADRGASAADAIAVSDGEADNDGNDDIDDPDDDYDYDDDEAGGPMTGHPGVDDKAAAEQTSFLTRLAAVKRKRGETDEVPLKGFSDYPVPADWDGIRQRARAIDEEDSETPKLGRPSGTPD